MQKNSEDFSMQEAMKIANSPAGKQLIALLQRSNSGQLQQVMDVASRGDMQKAAQMMGSLLSSPEAKRLVEELGGK